MSKFLAEMRQEAAVRVEGYKREKATLAKAAERTSELDALITEAQAEYDALDSRLTKEVPEPGVTETRTPNESVSAAR